MSVDPHLLDTARSIAETLGVRSAPEHSIERLAERLAFIIRQGQSDPLVMRAESLTVEPMLINPVPGLDAVLLVDSDLGQVALVGTPDDLREVGYGIVALADDEATS